MDDLPLFPENPPKGMTFQVELQPSARGKVAPRGKMLGVHWVDTLLIIGVAAILWGYLYLVGYRGILILGFLMALLESLCLTLTFFFFTLFFTAQTPGMRLFGVRLLGDALDPPTSRIIMRYLRFFLVAFFTLSMFYLSAYAKKFFKTYPMVMHGKDSGS